MSLKRAMLSSTPIFGPVANVAKVRPLLLQQHDDSNLPLCKILLVAQVFVSRYKNVKASGFGGRSTPTIRLLPNSFGREEKNQDNEEPLSDELTADFQTRYLHRGYQEHQEETA